MKEQLIQYVDLLFAGAQDSEEIKQEILQNTLDRYDDLIAQGKVPEAAYRLAISGIGDINEILGAGPVNTPAPYSSPEPEVIPDNDTPLKKLLRAIAIGLYILSPLPLFICSEMGMDTLGLCGTLVIVAVATVLIILGGKKEDAKAARAEEPEVLTPQQELRNAVHSAINTVGTILYFVVSFLTGAWMITWIIFPIKGAVWGLAKAILDLKEAKEYET